MTTITIRQRRGAIHRAHEPKFAPMNQRPLRDPNENMLETGSSARIREASMPRKQALRQKFKQS
jgi:hypothetical protein